MALSLEARINNLIVRFGDYVRAFDESPAFNDRQLAAHLETVNLRSRLTSARAAARDPGFASSLRTTLELWRMNVRGAKLAAESEFVASLNRYADDIGALENERIDADDLAAAPTADSLWRVIDRLRISDTQARLVAATKALHHLLPNLVVPMD